MIQFAFDLYRWVVLWSHNQFILRRTRGPGKGRPRIRIRILTVGDLILLLTLTVPLYSRRA